VHPLEGGAFRLKFRRDRRSGMKIESPLVFYPRYGWETLKKAWGYFRIYRRLNAMLKETLEASDRWTYSDIAIAAPRQDEFEQLSLYHATAGGEAALARKRRDDAIRAGHPTEAQPILAK
jgi:predicted neuraminidase